MAIFGVVRPALRKPALPPRAPASATVADPVELPPPPAIALGALVEANEPALQLARNNPSTVADVVRRWVNPTP